MIRFCFRRRSRAVKFTPVGGNIVFSLSEELVSEMKVILHILVSDTGCGMSREYMDRIFKPFEQETELTAKEHGGSGLGLSITKNFIELMGGKIEVRSEQGVGTTFDVEIPMGVSDNQVKLDHPAVSRMRAIVVDDDRHSLDYVAGILNQMGIMNECAESGEEALALITKARNDGRPFDVCLVDWMLKDGSGLELSKQIRATCGDHMLILIASAYDLNEIRNEAEQAGIDGCLSKPLPQSSLFDLLMSLSHGKLAKSADEARSYNFNGKRVLVADDNAVNRSVAKGYLTRVGFEVELVNDGAECVKAFETSQAGYYDLILMDVQMPELNGYDATKLIRLGKHPQAKSICIIAMTANAFADDIANSIKSGMNDHLPKPIDPNLMYQLIQRHL